MVRSFNEIKGLHNSYVLVCNISFRFNHQFSHSRQDGIAPNFIQKPVTRQDNSGKKLFFECALTADPVPAITWSKDNAVIAPGGDSMFMSGSLNVVMYFMKSFSSQFVLYKWQFSEKSC